MLLTDASGVAGRIGLLVEEPGLISGVILIALSLVVTFYNGRRRILWRDQLNVDVSIAPKEASRIGSLVTVSKASPPVAPSGIGPPAAESKANPPITWMISKHGTPLRVPSLALLRIRNGGFSRIDPADIDTPLVFEFPGRRVEWFEPTECSNPALERAIKEKWLVEAKDDRFTLNHFSLERGQRFSFLILLSKAADGQGPPDPAEMDTGRRRFSGRRDRTWNRGPRGKLPPGGWRIRGSAQIKGGGRTGGTLYERPRRGPGTGTLAVIGVILGVALALAGSVIGAAVGSGSSNNAASACFTGTLLIEGSTAFAPEARRIRQDYVGICHDARITINATGTYAGLEDLRNTGEGHPGAAAARVSMSDGVVKSSSYPGLKSNPVGAIIFSVVVNKASGISHLTLSQLRGIYRGKISNWSSLGGANLPITFVGRGTNSGTARTFDTDLLGSGVSEPQFSSDDCTTKDIVHNAKVVSCQAPNTAGELQDVDSNQGAIGYAQTSQVSGYTNVRSLTIDGYTPNIGNAENGDYHFWAVESLYTYGSPAAGTPAAEFRRYLTGSTAKDIAASQGYTPCADLPAAFKAANCG